MKINKRNNRIKEKTNNKIETSLKTRIIISYLMVLSFMVAVAGICIYQMKNIMKELGNTQSIIDNAAVQAVTKQNMRASITALQNSIDKFTSVAIVVSLIGFIVTIILAIILLRRILKP